MATLEEQIRQQWGGYGEWDAGGVDRVAELAALFRQNGIDDISKLSFGSEKYELNPGYWENVDSYETVGTGDSQYANLVQTPTWRDPTFGTRTTLTYGDKTLPFLGDANLDGSYSNMGSGDWRGENLLGWSARGEGNVGYHAVQAPDGSWYMAPNWASSSDMDKVRSFLKPVGFVVGGGLLAGAAAGALGGTAGNVGATLGNGAFLGEGVASGIGAWDGAATGLGSFLGEGVASGVGAWDAAASGAAGSGFNLSNVLNGAKNLISTGKTGMDIVDIGKLLLSGYGLYSSNKAAEGQQQIADNALAYQLKALEAMTKQADDLLGFNREVYADAKNRQVGLDALNEKVINLNMDLASKAGQRADESYQFYMDKGRPIIEQTFKDAQDYDSANELRNVSNRAQAGVQKAFDNTQAQNNRMLTRMGITPNSGRFATLNNQLQMQKAASIAGATQGAVEQRKAGAIGLRQQASNLAQGFPAQSLNQGTQASGTSVVGANTANMGANQHAQMAQNYMSGARTAAGLQGGVFDGYTNIANQASQNIGRIGQAAGAFGNLGGFTLDQMGYADGGVVRGPGTGTSDSVPAVNRDTGQRIQLSNGEYVVPASVVRAKGQEFFDKLVERYHTPVNGAAGGR